MEVQTFIRKKIDNSIKILARILLEDNAIEKPINFLNVLKKTSIKKETRTSGSTNPYYKEDRQLHWKIGHNSFGG